MKSPFTKTPTLNKGQYIIPALGKRDCYGLSIETKAETEVRDYILLINIYWGNNSWYHYTFCYYSMGTLVRLCDEGEIADSYKSVEDNVGVEAAMDWCKNNVDITLRTITPAETLLYDALIARWMELGELVYFAPTFV